MESSLRRHGELLAALVAKEFKVRYKHTVLGFLWSLANPIFFALVFFVAFRNILKVSVDNFLAFLLAGLFPWQWFATTVNSSATVYLANAGLIKKVRLPRLLIPASLAGNHLIHFMLALFVTIPVAIVYGSAPSVSWVIGIPILIVVEFALILGLSLILSSLNVFFRDLEHLTMVLTNLLFYMTPVLYPESLIPERYRTIFLLNPMASIVPSWRNLILEGRLDWSMIGIGSAGTLAVLLLGTWVYRSLEWRLAESL